MQEGMQEDKRDLDRRSATPKAKQPRGRLEALLVAISPESEVSQQAALAEFTTLLPFVAWHPYAA
jgi:hypothetical protein